MARFYFYGLKRPNISAYFHMCGKSCNALGPFLSENITCVPAALFIHTINCQLYGFGWSMSAKKTQEDVCHDSARMGTDYNITHNLSGTPCTIDDQAKYIHN